MENYNNNCNYYYRKKVKEDNFYGGSRSRSHNNKKFSNGGHQQSALSLEKQFCSTVGGISWEKVLDTQKYMYQDEKVIQWNDSAVQEAFWNAKNRFFAEMSGQPCDIQLPDPDSFIDKIDWDSNIDHELMSELDKRDLGTTSETEKDSGVVLGIPMIPDQFVLTPMGWGDAEDSQGQGEHSGRFDHTEKVNGWNDNDRIYNREYKPNGGSRWNGGNKNKWWNNGGYNKRRNNKWWNNEGWNDYRNGYGNSYHNSYGSNNRGNFSSDIQWKPKPVSNRQW